MANVIFDQTLHAAQLTPVELKQALAVMLFKKGRLSLMQVAGLA
jgi:predicted HTH domain antitoxin